ncbi:MAG: acetolactate decarboxylase [Spirochaetales bacterium]|nr:acetolactate decarboxylase [Spirochaetales bacterium]
MRSFALVGLLLLPLLFTGCRSLDTQSGRLSQVSLLNALLLGEYDGFVSVQELKTMGDTGIGTFDTLDGEMIMLDTAVYQAKADGTVVPVADSMLVPFAMTTHYSPTIDERKVSSLEGIETLKTYLDEVIGATTNDFNRFYAAKLTGSFTHVRVRSVPAQEKPYQRLSVIAAQQKEYVYENLEGTIVALRCPPYVEGINMSGWHLHFLSSDRSKGGHLLEVDIEEALLGLGDMRTFHLILPDSESFASLDITHDLSRETQAIEGMRK